jgi:HK97 family phage portal protein
VPATEIIHDLTSIRHHPLCGIPPLIAAALPATQGLRISTQSTAFFDNRATPGGILTAPGEIKTTTAERIKEYWSGEFQGGKSGKIAVLGDGLKFEPLSFTAVDSQLIEQLGLSAKMVCSAFGVPAHMVGAADPPSYNNIEALNQQYYSQCLQKYFESVELLLDEGLGLTEVPGKTYGTEFDLDDLLRMDTSTLVESEGKAVGAGIKKPNESRKRLNLAPVVGGDTPYLQQQNYSLSALNKRDTQADPFAPSSPPALPPSRSDSDTSEPDATDAAAIAQLAAWQFKHELDLLRAG